MDEKVLNEAVENISLIKGVIDRTSKSFVAFSRIFIYWGMLFIVNGVISLIMGLNKDKFFDIMSRFPNLGYIFPIGLIALVAAVIYWNISKKIPLVGLEKHLMKMWMLILIMNVIPVQIRISSTDSTIPEISKIVIESNNFSIMLFSLAIALIVTSLFAGYKSLMNLGIIYIAISLIHAYFRLPVLDQSLLHVLYSLHLPFTFIYTGLYLKSQQLRRN